MATAHSLASVPQEILEHIAYFTATTSFLGPPSPLIPLLSTSRRIHDALAFDKNPHIWARIFTNKFDLAAALRRLGPDRVTPVTIAQELRKRCMVLRRIRAKTDTLAPIWDLSPGHSRQLSELLWMAYLMMLENDGKNERQLREYARMDAWLRTYLLDENGASLVRSTVRRDQWPAGNDERVALAMWLFWMLLRPGASLCLSEICGQEIRSGEQVTRAEFLPPYGGVTANHALLRNMVLPCRSSGIALLCGTLSVAS